MSAEKYLDQILKNIRNKHSDKPEFIQAVTEFLTGLAPYLKENPEMIKTNILELMIEPERIIQFRVPWEDDEGNWRVNLAWRVQYNSTLGPYKGGIRFDTDVNESVLRFLGFEQTFKNALTTLPLGGGKGGSDFNPKGKSEREIMRFTQSFMTELQKYIGPNLDVPAGDIGVGHREISYMYGQYKRLNQPEFGVITGKPTNQWGSFGRTEATGYGVVYFAEKALKDRNSSIAGQRVAVSGCGNVGTYAIEKAIELGATVVAISNSTGYIYDGDGIDLNLFKSIKNGNGFKITEYAKAKDTATFFKDRSIWEGKFNYDIAFPCATQNEITEKMALNMVKNCKIKAVFEGANMPNTDSAVKIYKDNNILFAPGKAANAGGVAVSALEMSQNAQRTQWTKEEVDKKLQMIMSDIYDLCSQTAEKYSEKNDLQTGANIAGFARVAHSMIEQGLV